MISKASRWWAWPATAAAVTAAVMTLGGCHRTTKAAATSGPSTTVGTAPATAPTSAPPPTTAPAPAGPDRCHSSQLQFTLSEGNGAAGHIAIPVIVKNASSQPCRMFGFVGVRLSDRQGKDLGVTVQRGNGFAGGNPAPQSVLLAPARTTKFLLEYTDVPQADGPCPTAVKVEFFPPDERDAVGASPSSPQNFELMPCNGQVTVTPVGSSTNGQP